ncbi:MAG: hypothetical protein ACXACC_05485 [Promethearchaeota archaeon]|jgi:hypothetical protein
MSDRKPEKETEIWLKYCEDCVRSLLSSPEDDNDDFSGDNQDGSEKKFKY